MCLTVREVPSWEEHGWVEGWKWLRFIEGYDWGPGIARSMRLVAPMQSHYEYQVGVNKAVGIPTHNKAALRRLLKDSHQPDLNAGVLHLYTSKSAARRSYLDGPDSVLVQVWAHSRDILAEGNWFWTKENFPEMAATKLTIEKEEFERAIKAARRKAARNRRVMSTWPLKKQRW